MSWGIGYAGRGPLDPLPGEPDRKEALLDMATALTLSKPYGSMDAGVDTASRLVVRVGGYRYRLALVAVEEVGK